MRETAACGRPDKGRLALLVGFDVEQYPDAGPLLLVVSWVNGVAYELHG